MKPKLYLKAKPLLGVRACSFEMAWRYISRNRSPPGDRYIEKPRSQYRFSLVGLGGVEKVWRRLEQLSFYIDFNGKLEGGVVYSGRGVAS